MAKNVRTRNQVPENHFGALDPNELKSVVRDGLVAMNMAEREDFIKALDADMKREKLVMGSYLIPLGIPARSAEDLTPTEVGHLVRFLKINVPQAMPAIERVMARYPAFGDKNGRSGGRMAA